MGTAIKHLARLYARVDACKRCLATRNPLVHIFGFGAMRPTFMLVLVNPTYRSISSDPNYRGDRFPFIGVRQFWNVLGDGGLIERKTARMLPVRQEWKKKHTDLVKRQIVKDKLFLTNVVKCCSPHGNYPKPEIVTEQMEFLKEEIRIVRPKRIVAFGALVFEALTGRKVKLSDYWGSGKLRNGRSFTERVSGLKIPVIPCFFPIGRGKPKEAARALRKIKRLVR